MNIFQTLMHLLLSKVLFDWTSHALTGFYNKKVDVPSEVVEGLWTYLDDILHSRKLHDVLSQGKTISLRLTLAQVFTSTSVLQ